jgi:hypothetical protein
MQRRVRHLATIGLALSALALVTTPYAAATTYYAPPWGNAWLGGPWTYEYNILSDANVWLFDTNLYTGHSYTGSWVSMPGGGQGSANVRTTITYSQGTLTGPYNGYFDFSWTWRLTGLAEQFNAIVPIPPGQGIVTTTIRIYLYGTVYDQTAHVQLAPSTLTVLDYSQSTIVWHQTFTYSNTQYTVSSGQYPYPLYLNHVYQVTTYVETYDSSVVGGLGAFGFAFGDVNITASATSFLWTPHGGGGGGCALGGTAVTMSDGTSKPIEKLKPGDQVMSYNLTQGVEVPVLVVSNTRSVVDQIEVINEGLLSITTYNQPLYVRNGTWQGWVQNPSELRTGMELFRPTTQDWVTIYSISTETGHFRVYDLVTSDVNNFIGNGLLLDKKG